MDLHIRIAELKNVPTLTTTLFNSDTNIYGENGTGFGDRDIEDYALDEKKRLFVCKHGDKIVGALMAEYHETYSHLETRQRKI